MKSKYLLCLNLMVISIIFTVFNCTNSIDDDPLRWKTTVEVPITNKAFIMGEELDNLFNFDSTMDVINGEVKYSQDDIRLLKPDTVRGDTLVFSVFNSDTSMSEINNDKMEDKKYTVSIGPIVISGADTFTRILPIPPAAGNFSIPVTIPIRNIYKIAFYDTISNKLSVTLKNLSAVNITGLSFGIGRIDTSEALNIPAGASVTTLLSAAGKMIDSTANLIVSGISSAGAGKQIQISMSLNGLHASAITANDSLINFSRSFINPYEITDTVDIDYVDMQDGFFNYEITNKTSLELRVRCVHDHLWKTSFSEEKNIIESEDLLGISRADSVLHYLGWVTSETDLIARPRVEQTFRTVNVSACRLFPEWDPTIEKSISNVRYTVFTGTPTGKRMTLNSSDTIIFTIKSDLKFKEFLGTVMSTYKFAGDTQKIALNLPWNDAVKDSLKGRLELKNVFADVQVKVDIPKDAFIDTVQLAFEAFPIDSQSVKSSELTKFLNVQRDSMYKRLIDIKDVTNCFPDSVAIFANMTIPVGTRLKAVNDLLSGKDSVYNKYIGRMIISTFTNYRLNAVLDWEVKSRVNMDLGSGHFEMLKPLRLVGKFDQRQASFNMKVFNKSNLNMYLYALIAPQSLMTILDSMPSDQVHNLLMNKDKAESLGFVNFLGTKGVYIPPRDSTEYNSVTWNNDQLEKVLSSDSCSWRWWLQFPVQERDALNDTDFIKINSWFHVDGINNTDSLLIW